MRPLLGLLIAALVVTACADPGGGDGGDDSTTTTETTGDGATHPSEGDEVVLRIRHEGGFVPVEFNLTAMPALTLYGDGAIIVPGPQIAIYPGPALPSIQRLRIDEARIQEVISAARRAGIAGEERHYGHDCVADAATTVFTLHADGTVTTVSVYALGLELPDGGADPGCGVDVEAAEARRALAAFATSMEALVFDSSIEPPVEYEPEAMRVFVTDDVWSDPDLPQEPVEWPLATPLAELGEPVAELGYRCAVVDGDALATLLEVAGSTNQLTPWLSSGEEYRLSFRPLLPDESGC